MRFQLQVFTILVFSLLSNGLMASDFYPIDQALPSNVNALSIAPVFDFDGDGCLPSAGISRSGDQNGGLNPSGGLTEGCRSSNFLETSNTVHRHACMDYAGASYCVHFYALYFEKDQIFNWFGGGHRHDWEHVAIWTINGQVAFGSYSAHGDLFTQPASNLPFTNGHLKIVYHKDGIGTHAFRFAKVRESAENSYGKFVIPIIISWTRMSGDDVSNSRLRRLLNSYDYGSATLPLKDNNFLANINNYRPGNFPYFNATSIDAGQ